ncbi:MULTISPECIES: DUF1963 domain-containing protein [Roseobacteraceae]|uniref:DUF1963 domain-containing protein n=1 Tax=Pseudosulfitobacter pseudonitzschiae TaxID=1402135 RepID=A0A221JWB6_9RHOB|nr:MULTISPECIES: DUF1963 domain-containing protein [Roseobacteraceae]ASM71034.1 hypothetical protein SULPSESMR1_00196 [Pseudosulfitobacter pseudonitzschiae]
MAQRIGEFPVYKQASLPLPATREELRTSLGDLKQLTPALVDRLSEQALPAVSLETVPHAEASIPLGASKMGGAPDLPRGMPWPMRPPYADAQIKLEHYRSLIGVTLAKAGIVPEWMTPDEGKHYVAEQRRIEKEVVEGALAMLPKEEANEIRQFLESQSIYTPERAREETRDHILQAQMVARSFPLSFIAQLDLGKLSAQPGFDPDLPKNGRLMLFYDLLETPPGWEPSSRVGFRLIWDETPAIDLIRVSVPAALSETQYRETLVLEPALIIPHSVATPIPPSVKAWDADLLDQASSQEFGEGPYWSYMAWLSRFGSSDEPGRINHQLGGWPQSQQNGMQAQAQLASNGIFAGTSYAYDTSAAKEILKGAADWKLVLQVGADEAVGLRGGAYYVLMRHDDLLERRFDKAWVVHQSN